MSDRIDTLTNRIDTLSDKVEQIYFWHRRRQRTGYQEGKC